MVDSSRPHPSSAPLIFLFFLLTNGEERCLSFSYRELRQKKREIHTEGQDSSNFHRHTNPFVWLNDWLHCLALASHLPSLHTKYSDRSCSQSPPRLWMNELYGKREAWPLAGPHVTTEMRHAPRPASCNVSR